MGKIAKEKAVVAPARRKRKSLPGGKRRQPPLEEIKEEGKPEPAADSVESAETVLKERIRSKADGLHITIPNTVPTRPIEELNGQLTKNGLSSPQSQPQAYSVANGLGSQQLAFLPGSIDSHVPAMPSALFSPFVKYSAAGTGKIHENLIGGLASPAPMQVPQSPTSYRDDLGNGQCLSAFKFLDNYSSVPPSSAMYALPLDSAKK